MTPYPPLIPSQDSRASVPNAPRALITHARSCTQSSRHAQPGAPGGRGRMARGPLPRRNRPRPEQVFSTRGPADSCVLPAVPVPCRYILRNVSLLLTSRRGQGGAQGLDRAHSPLRLPPSTGHSENLPRPAACESGPHNAGPATRSSFFGGGSGGSILVSESIYLPTAL